MPSVPITIQLSTGDSLKKRLLGDGDCKFARIIIMFIYICFQRFIGTLVYNCGGSLLNIIVGGGLIICSSLRVTGRQLPCSTWSWSSWLALVA